MKNGHHHIYLAPRGFAEELKRELGGLVMGEQGELILAKPYPTYVSWAQDIWYDAKRIPISSIADGVKKLKSLGLRWWSYPAGTHRRAALIQDQLPKLRLQPILFDENPPPEKKIGGWALVAQDEIWASPRRWKGAPGGVLEFVENKNFPPNRAYLKLWEAFTLIGERPRSGDLCLDLGSSPGGWTWVLQSLGADVLSVDKADLDPKIAKLQRVRFEKRSAFSVEPGEFGRVDWLCCDVACYPDRLYAMVTRWLKAGACRNMICTVKLQGNTDFDAIEKFKSIPDSQLLHLYHNKHELTWIWPARKILEQL